MHKAIGYVRVSLEKQVEGTSLENQMERIRQYCEYKNLNLISIIKDAGVSGGKNKDREGFNQLLNMLESGEGNVVILYSLERLSRDMLTLLAIERLLDEYEVELHTIEGQVDTSTPDGFMSFAMRSFLGEMERRQVKFRTKRIMQHMKNQGAVVGAIPYGFKRNGDMLEPEPIEQDVIEVVNASYSNGMRLVDICAHLRSLGHKTRNGKKFTPTQVKRLITDYRGVWKKSNTVLSQNIKDFILSLA